MSEFIPWNQLMAHGVVGADSHETVETVRQRLCRLGKDRQYNAPILIRAAGGAIAPTAAPALRKLTQERGPALLGQRLESLLADLCPEPWSAEDQEAAAREARRRRLPVLVVEAGRPAGLMLPPPRLALMVMPDRESFDLFDEPLSRDTLPPDEFVTGTLDTTVARIATDLKALDQAGEAHVIVTMDDGSLRVLFVGWLNDEVRRRGERAWAMPLGYLASQPVFALHLEMPEVREVGTVGRDQAQALAELRGGLVLTDQGRPLGLIPRRVMRAAAGATAEPSAAGHDLFDVPPQALEPFLVAPRRAEAPAEPERRFANLWFANREGGNLNRTEPLTLRQSYRLKVNIGRRREESIVRGAQPAIVEPIPETPQGTRLYVSVFSDDFDVPSPTQPLLLPPQGDAVPVEFEVTPTRHTTGPDDRATLDVHIYYRCNLVQSWQVRAEVVAPGQAAQSPVPQEAVLLAARTDDYTALERLGPRQLSLTIDKAPGGAYHLDLVVAADEQADEIRLGCRISLRREDLTHLITKARRQLYNIARARAYQQDVAGDPPTRGQAMRALALLGRQLYNRLFELADPKSSAAQVADWIENHVSEGSTFQIVDRAREFVFPWSLVYDGVPWDESGLSEQVDLGRFWGWRYQIELLTEELLQTYKVSGVEIETPEGLQVGVGLNDEIPWSADQRQLFDGLRQDCGDRAQYNLIDSSPELTEFLKHGRQHIFYVFCHGFTERMAADIQVGDDLIGEFKAWVRTLPADERAALKDQEASLFNVSDSWIKLTFGQVPLTMMEYYAAPHLEYTPLVFLNMCESAQVLPSLSGGFIPFFIQRGARGVIGTECPMTSTFAHPFSQAFFRRFLEGQPVGQVLWELRRDYLEQGNPLGLAYTLYGDANTRLGEAILQSQNRGKEQEMANDTLERQVGKLWLKQEEDLYTTLGIQQQAVETAEKKEDAAQLDKAQQYDAVFSAQDTEMGVLDDLKDFGKEWWAKLEPKIYDLLCNDRNPQHDEVMTALGKGAKMLAVALAPALVAQAAALPAVAIVLATLAAKKVYEAGHEAACKMWATSMEERAAGTGG